MIRSRLEEALSPVKKAPNAVGLIESNRADLLEKWPISEAISSNADSTVAIDFGKFWTDRETQGVSGHPEDVYLPLDDFLDDP